MDEPRLMLNRRFRIAIIALTATLSLSASAAFAQEAISPDAPTTEGGGTWSEDEGTNVTAIFNRATELAENGQAREAIDAYKEVAGVDPYWADAFYNVGVLSAETGQVVDCALFLRRYLTLRPNGDESDDVERRLHRCESAMGETGILRIPLTNPSDAMIFIDGVPIDEGGIERIELPAGRYDIFARRVDYDDYRTEIRVRANETTAQDITMTAQDLFGKLIITSTEDDATITVNGDSIDWQSSIDEPLDVQVGRYYVLAEKDGFYRWHRYVNVYRDARTTVEVRMIDEDTDLEELLDR